MRFFHWTAALFVCIATVVFPGSSAAKPNLPSTATVTISRTSWTLSFAWNGAAPNFDEDLAVEFQVEIDPKCFSQPVGGKDNSTTITKPHNLPEDALPYLDVWNYWQPPKNELVGAIEGACGKLDPVQKLAIGLIDYDFTDSKASFAIGVHYASKLKQGVTYFFEYPLEIPIRPECCKFFSKIEAFF